MKLDMAEKWFRDVAANPDGSDTHEAFVLMVAELDRLRGVERAAQAYVMAGMCGNRGTSVELAALIDVARTDRSDALVPPTSDTEETR